MLRASSEEHSERVDLHSLMESDVDSGIENGAELVAFAEAVVARDVLRVARSRDRLLKSLGSEKMIDAAGVVSNFQRMVRIANATGIGLGQAEQPTAALRKTLGINAFRQTGDE